MDTWEAEDGSSPHTCFHFSPVIVSFLPFFLLFLSFLTGGRYGPSRPRPQRRYISFTSPFVPLPPLSFAPPLLIPLPTFFCCAFRGHFFFGISSTAAHLHRLPPSSCPHGNILVPGVHGYVPSMAYMARKVRAQLEKLRKQHGEGFPLFIMVSCSRQGRAPIVPAAVQPALFQCCFLLSLNRHLFSPACRLLPRDNPWAVWSPCSTCMTSDTIP